MREAQGLLLLFPLSSSRRFLFVVDKGVRRSLGGREHRPFVCWSLLVTRVMAQTLLTQAMLMLVGALLHMASVKGVGSAIDGVLIHQRVEI
jgi:hypothetical protein